MVGFTTTRRGITRQVALTPTAPKVPPAVTPGVLPEHGNRVTKDGEVVEHRGILLIANAKKKSDKQSGVIEIVGENDLMKLIVPPGMMSDIVKPLWESGSGSDRYAQRQEGSSDANQTGFLRRSGNYHKSPTQKDQKALRGRSRAYVARARCRERSRHASPLGLDL